MSKLTIIAAMDEQRLIGAAGGGLPWGVLPRDQRHFRDYTAGKALLIGRRTFEEMAGWFDDGHRPIVVSRDPGYDAGERRAMVPGVAEGLALAAENGEDELVVCGGASIYRLALPLADELLLTLVHAEFEAPEGGAYFPDWEGQSFTELRRQRFEADAENPYAMTFLRLRKEG